MHDTRLYVRHRLSVAGGSPDLIDTDAVDLAWSRASGVPRLLNQLCDTALVYGFADQCSRIDLKLMAQVVEDRVSGGIFPAVAAAAAPSHTAEA